MAVEHAEERRRETKVLRMRKSRARKHAPCMAKTQGGQEQEGRRLKPQPLLEFPRKRQGRAG